MPKKAQKSPKVHAIFVFDNSSSALKFTHHAGAPHVVRKGLTLKYIQSSVFLQQLIYWSHKLFHVSFVSVLIVLRLK